MCARGPFSDLHKYFCPKVMSNLGAQKSLLLPPSEAIFTPRLPPEWGVEAPMSIYISTKQNQLVDEDFYGRKIKYKLWEPEKGIPMDDFQTLVKKAHEQVKQCIPFEDRNGIQGKDVREKVRQYLTLTPEEQRYVRSKGFDPMPKVIQEEVLLMRDLLLRFQKEDKDRQKIKTVFLNDGYILMWIKFLDRHCPKLTYAQFSKETVEAFVTWREGYRLPNDVRTGRVSAETINKEIGEAMRCVKWARNKRIVKEDYNAFYRVKQKKTGENSTKRVPHDREEQLTLLEWLRQAGNPWAHDAFLLLLITGMRVGDWEALERIHFNEAEGMVEIHQIVVGGLKTGGKTANASRTLTLTPTLKKLAERGLIFERTKEQTRGERLANFLRRKRNITPIPFKTHPHLLRHTFATNFACSFPEQLAYLSAILCHSSLQTTIDNYAAFARQRNHLKQRQLYSDHMRFLDNEYFDKVSPPITKEEWDKQHLWYVEKNKKEKKKAA